MNLNAIRPFNWIQICSKQCTLECTAANIDSFWESKNWEKNKIMKHKIGWIFLQQQKKNESQEVLYNPLKIFKWVFQEVFISFV